MFPSTLDFDLLRCWIDVLTNLYDTSIVNSDPIKVIDIYEESYLSDFQNEFLGRSIAVDKEKQKKAEIAANVIAGYIKEGD
jgi:hypothetical protein